MMKKFNLEGMMDIQRMTSCDLIIKLSDLELMNQLLLQDNLTFI